MTLSGVWGSNFSFVLKKWLPRPGYFDSEIDKPWLFLFGDLISGVDYSAYLTSLVLLYCDMCDIIYGFIWGLIVTYTVLVGTARRV